MIDLHDLPEIHRLAELAVGAPGIPTTGEAFILALQSLVLNTIVGAHRAGRFDYRDDLLDEAVPFVMRCADWSMANTPPKRRAELLEYIQRKAIEPQPPSVVVTGGQLTAEELARLLDELQP